ncbi:unnamed protein product [Leptidea sinapis]|uniref:Dystroglycan-type cadherin-like domain-containing protein n=1 Tax=Leptidea sinapis TaxID=189913 RepID=A0A5E4QXM4_9NEOP|nr:unnamed protein product [Leptidea sinapis]
MVLVWLLLVLQPALGLEYHAVETEMFAIPVSPNLFNWTYQEFDQQYRFHASLAGSPELTSWLRHEVELKIDNLNVEDLLDQHSLVVRLGSAVPFSSELKRLREEVRPLSRLPSCPREFKRTTVERLFRDAGFTLDWCSFELYNTVYNERSTQRYEYLTEIPNTNRSNSKVLASHEVWRAPSKHALPSRSYLQQLSVTIALPLLLMLLSVATLSAILCFQYAG